MNLNFSISELIHSDNAIKAGIDNTPTIKEIDNLLNLIFYFFLFIRDKLKKPMIITSGYRNMKVNFLAGGVINSGHLKGTCADFIVKGMTTRELFNFICNSGINFTQLIEEHKKNASWIHIEYDKQNLKNEKFKYIDGKYIKVL